LKRSLLTVAAAAIVCALALTFWTWQEFESPGPNPEDKTIILPRGASLRAIAKRLGDEGVLDQPAVFVFAVMLSGQGQRLKAGEYRFAARLSPRGVMDLLASGRVVVRKLTAPEGLTVAEICALVAQADGLAGDMPPLPAEGTLLPQTYNFVHGDERRAMVERMSKAMSDTLAELWPRRQSDLPYRTPQEAVVMASIIEKETAVAAERPKVAGVFVNRLRRGMRLQSDPTVAYGINPTRGDLERPLTRDDLDRHTAWNTYRIDGLPPTPIASPGRASLEAALQPQGNSYLYFVADGAGGHAFAETLDEHNRNVARWRKLQSGR
jgi:UPF0755 protein